MRQHQVISTSNGRGIGLLKLGCIGLLALVVVLATLAFWLEQVALQNQYATERIRLDSLVANFTRSVATLQGRQQRQHEAQVSAAASGGDDNSGCGRHC